MRSKFFTAALALAVLAVPAAVPASQPATVRLADLAPLVAVTPQANPLALLPVLLLDPAGPDTAQLSIELPQTLTTFEWIDQDPFAL